MWVYISTVTRCARLAADVGWPEPAAVVMSSDNLIRSMALACTEATKAIFYSSSLTRVRVQSRRRLARTHDQPPGQVKLIGVHCHRFGLDQGGGTGAELLSLILGTGSVRRYSTLKRAIPMPPALAARRASWQALHVDIS